MRVSKNWVRIGHILAGIVILLAALLFMLPMMLSGVHDQMTSYVSLGLGIIGVYLINRSRQFEEKR